MNILLIAWLWLDGSASKQVAEPLRAHGHHVVPVTLPGQGAPPPKATLHDQHLAVVATADETDGEVLVVGHSAACALAWMAADARPDRVARVVMIGGFPSGDGCPYLEDTFSLVDGLMPFPGWEPDSVDLDERQREAIAAAAFPVREGVVRGIVTSPTTGATRCP